MATIGDVAREAGVARSTASAVLTGRKYVSPETRSKVEAAIKKLDFTVNSGARALATARTMVLAVDLGPETRRVAPSLSSYLMALAEEARKVGYRITLIAGAESGEALERAIATKSVDGVIIMDVLEDDPRIDTVRKSRVPGVVVGMPNDTENIDAVDLDYAQAGRLAVQQMADADIRRVALVCWPSYLYEEGATYALHFLRGATEEARASQIELRVLASPLEPEKILPVLEDLRRDPDTDGVIVHNDAAIPLLPAFLAHCAGGIRKVIGVAAKDIAHSYLLPFDTVATRPLTTARVAIDHLVQRLDRKEEDFRRTLLEPSLNAAVGSR